MRKKLSAKKINEAFELMGLLLEQDREPFKQLASERKDVGETYVFIRATLGTKELESEAKDARLE
ncbi:MAG: hypothetical protein HYX84_07105 [Chloroflexi bacterium]|nr:hypothetical protein [Chloroflexota bacterium]